MRNPLSKVITEIEPSGIRKFFDIVSEMKDAISLGAGMFAAESTIISNIFTLVFL